MPPDFGSANIVLGILGAGAAVVYVIYQLQVMPSFLVNLFNSGKKSSEERMTNLLIKYQEETFNLDTSIRSNSSMSPRLQMLRTAKQEDELTCLLVNQGGTATNLQIEAPGALRARIEPTDTLDNGQAGSVWLSNINSGVDQLQFQLSYNDSLGMRVVTTYMYAEDDKKFIAV